MSGTSNITGHTKYSKRLVVLLRVLAKNNASCHDGDRSYTGPVYFRA